MSTHDERMTDMYPDTGHIPLRCKNHPEKRWSTKNIGFIGARSIFYARGWGYGDDANMGHECDCSMRDLEIVPPTEGDKHE